MNNNDKKDNCKLGDYSNGVNKINDRKKVGYITRIITIATSIVIISRLIFVFYPLDLKEAAGIKNITADDVYSISFQQIIWIPKGMDIEVKEISMDDIGRKLDELWPLPLSEYSEPYLIFMPDITHKGFIEEILLALSNHTMRKRSSGGNFPIDNAMPDSTTLFIHLDDASKTQVIISIEHDPRQIGLIKLRRNYSPRYYTLYGDGIDTQKLFELTRKF